MKQINVLFFGPARDLAGVETAVIEVADGAVLADLREQLGTRFPALQGGLAKSRLAINNAFADDDAVLCGGDEVAVIPPVSGGCGRDDLWVNLVAGPIPAERVRDFVLGQSTLGGIVTFEGATRIETHAEHGRLIHLEYEAHESMARSQLAAIAADALDRWSLGRLAIVHRLGAVPVGEVSVMIAVAAGHRAESFEACCWLIDSLKRDVPIWKKDVYEDGQTKWVDPQPGP